MNADGDFRMPVYAPAEGWVEVKTTGPGDTWGNSIHWISADRKERIHLAHLDGLATSGIVEGGELIGYVGSTGRSDSPHLHASRWRDGPADLVLSGAEVRAGGCWTSAGQAPARPPKTTVGPSASKPHRLGWTRGSWVIRLSCRDDWSGCARTSHRVDAGTAREYAEPLEIRMEGRHTLDFWSVDTFGHEERPKTAQFSIDRTAPRVTLDVPDPPIVVGTTSGAAEFRARASDPEARTDRSASGVHSVVFEACGRDGTCRTFTALREADEWVARPDLAPGTYSVRAIAEDVAYNRAASQRASITVVGRGHHA